MSEGQETVTAESLRVEEATGWILRFQECGESQLPEDELYKWLEWSSNRENGITYDELLPVMEFIKACPRPRVSSGANSNDTRPYLPVSMDHSPEPCRFPDVPKRNEAVWIRRNFAMVAAVAALAIGLVVLLREFEWPWNHATSQVTMFATNKALETTLADGSRVTLGVGSTLHTRYNGRFRTIVLEQGEALFNVARDSARPFVVLTSAGSITALGTAFNVLKRDDAVIVTVTEGAVKVAPEAPLDLDVPMIERPILSNVRWPAVRIAVGEGMTFKNNGTAGPIEQIDPIVATAWLEGNRIYQDDPLQTVVNEVNRYSHRKIVLDPSAAALPFTGSVVLGRIDAWINNLPKIFPVDVEYTDAEHVTVHTRQ